MSRHEPLRMYSKKLFEEDGFTLTDLYKHNLPRCGMHIYHYSFDDPPMQGVLKYGGRVRPDELRAMELVKQYTSVPVSQQAADFDPEFTVSEGAFCMTYIPGKSLESCWSTLTSDVKQQVCLQIWDYIQQWQKIPKPDSLPDHFLCLAAGSNSPDILLADSSSHARFDSPLRSHGEILTRIFARYCENNGGKDLWPLLPHTRKTISLFTHADLAPRNILFNEKSNQIGIIDWENAGWYPDYWEFIKIFKPTSDPVECDWQRYMEATAPSTWKSPEAKEILAAINVARGVLIGG
ncbi:hypothetical protein M011DRAFT_179718 [Sporormia fimetaria CBS 119925]|uniref:Aminoglycoside phosphotransferase domain-containing protein n=1 Tax=Sporormia fimetaria CBS 119925 TaxID=1340428 RepID=A0A6A6VJ79_9PLEO|nr:hypothetical protein M011DRAFT_179718 [Sporormia fimetaria CBS 119925]